MQAVQTLMITSVTRHQQCFSTRNTEVKGRNNAAPITQGVIEAVWRLPRRNPETGVAMRRELVCECVLFVPLLNNLRYIFKVQRLSIISKSDSNNPYLSCSRPTFWSSQIMAITHAPLVSTIIIPKPLFLVSVASPLRPPSLNASRLFDLYMTLQLLAPKLLR
jgi:hypothetical protein